MAELKNTIVNGVLNVNGDAIASTIIKRGGADTHVLLAGGGTKAISDFATADVGDGYLPLTGGQMSGPITYPTANGNNKTSNYISAGGGYATGSGKQGLKVLALDQSDATMGLGVDLTGGPYELTVATSRVSNSQSSKIVFATHTVGSTAYKALATLLANGAETPTATFNVAGTIQENGTALSTKYLGISAKAADADKLDGQDGSYYLNYNNLSNKPTIPTVNNGTLTIQKNGTNVATFTANQSGNTTADITVPNPENYYWADVKVSASSSTATTPSVQKIGITGSTTATAAAAVTMEYDSSYKALKFVFA